MKRIILGLMVLFAMLFFVGCSNSSQARIEAKKQIIEEIQQTLDQEDVQAVIAFGDSYESKKDLLTSSDLKANGLVALCTNPYPLNIDNGTIQNWFAQAIERTDLSPEQQIHIAKIGEYAYSKALLLSSNLSSDGLIAICECSPNGLNLKSKDVQNWFAQAIEKTDLSSEQQVQIAKIGKFAYSRALLLSSTLTPDGLVAVCENPNTMNLKSKEVQKWFKQAIEKTDLSPEQQVQIAKIGKYAYSRALLLSSTLTPDGLVAVCENPNTMNLKSKEVQKWFKQAIQETDLTSEQEMKIAKSEVGGIGLF